MILRLLRINSLLILLTLCAGLIHASSPLIPYESQQYYDLENKVTIQQLTQGSEHETSYTFNSLLKINSVWNTDKEQLIQVYFTKSRVTAPGKKGNAAKVQEIEKIPDRPFYISFIDNKPSKVIAHTSRDQSLLNIERGIASLMHINFENGPVSEIDVSGICNNFYNIKSSTKVNKIKTDCSHWDLKVNYRAEKPLGVHQKSMERVEYDLSADGQLLKANSVESHKIYLEAQPELGSQVESVFMFKHSAFGSEAVEQMLYKTSEEAIKSLLDWYRVFDIEADVDGAISEIKGVTLKQQISSFAKDLTDHLIGKKALATAFAKLIPLARITKEKEFIDILKSHKNLLSQLVDLLGAVQTIDAHNAIHTVLDYDKTSDLDLLEKYLQSLSGSTHPERAIIEDLLKRLVSTDQPIKNEKLKDSVLQCAAALTRQSSFDVNDELLKKIKNFILKNLLDECEDGECKTLYIRALQNLQDPSTIGVLLKHALEEEAKVSVAAMQALKSFSIIHFNEQHRQAFTRIFYQLQKKYDSSARTMALDILLNLKPTPEQLGHLLDYLASADRHFEIKTYVIQKLRMLSEKCPRFKVLLESKLYQRPHVNNYHIMGQKGLTTVLSRDLSWYPAFNESLLSIQEISQGVLKRGSVELILAAGKEETSTFKLGIYTSGLSSFVGDSDGTKDEDEDEEVDDSPATAGMEIAVQGVSLRPLVFFNGQSELMGHVWSGTASEPTPAFQATTLAQDHEHYIILSSGATVYTRVIGTKSIDLNGKVELSIWNRNANTEIQQNSAAAVHGLMKAGFTYAFVSNEFLLTYEPKISLQADIDFYSSITLCMQLQRPEMQLKRFNTKSVTLKSTKNYTKKVSSQYSFTFPGRTLALNQKNNEMCNIIFN